MSEAPILQGHRDLKVFQLAPQTAMDIFQVTKAFPKAERCSLIDQLRRSLRSVAANIAEAYRKRQYPPMFVSKLADADAEATETQVWLDFARDGQYLAPADHTRLAGLYTEIGKILGSMIAQPEKFTLPNAKR